MRQTTSLNRLFRKLEVTVLLRCLIACIACCGMTLLAPALPAQDFVVTQSSTASRKKTPLDLVLRSIAVVEWTGAAGKPSASMLIPVAVFTNGQYMDGGAYLAQPVPLSVQQGTQYILEKSGVPRGEYNVNAAGQMHGAWFGSGTWEPLQPSRSKLSSTPAEDSDRPHFFSSNSQTASPENNSASGKNLPTLHLRPPAQPAGTPRPDLDRPLMRYGKPEPVPTGSDLEASPAVSRALKMQQIVAISDATERETRSLAYNWISAAQKEAMQRKIEALAEKFLQTSQQKAQAAGKKPPAEPSAPEKFHPVNVDFRCFALTHEKKASEETPTCIYSAQDSEKTGVTQYVTVIARPDIYGAPKAISHAETNSTQLSTHPRVQLVDAVNATGDQSAELLFEIDSQTDRQFALYTISDDKLSLVYVTGKLPF